MTGLIDDAPALLSNYLSVRNQTGPHLLREFGKFLNASDARSFARAAVLLCLVAHATLVTVTHQHSESGFLSVAACRVEISRSDRSQGPLGRGPDTCCISCCLQRNFVNSISPISIPPDVCPEPVIEQVLVLESTSSGIAFVLSDRAPPFLAA
jgi:hypothetical protein